MKQKIPEVVTLAELRSFLPIDDRMIQKLASEGTVKKVDGERGKYYFKESVIGYVEKMTHNDNKKKKLSRAQTADARYKEIKADREERKLKMENLELVEADNIELILSDVVSQWFAILSAIPMRVRRRFPEYARLTNKDGERLDSMIKKEINRQRSVVPKLTSLRSIETLLDDDLLAEENEKLEEQIVESFDSDE